MSETNPPQPPAGNPPPPRRLYRSQDRMIAGVCGGIAEYLNVDPTLVRILTVASIFLGGAALVAYLVAWVIVPEAPEAPTT